ncbi:MAG: TRAP-type C4-dicarboxylate transport system, periplasmic component, partial [uncultured Ramlibacter sp.]
LPHRVAGPHVHVLQGRAFHRRAVPVPRPGPLEQGARRRPAQAHRRRDRRESRRDADRVCRRRRAQHLLQQAGVQPGRHQGPEGPSAGRADLEPGLHGSGNGAHRDRLQRDLQRHPERRDLRRRERGGRRRVHEVQRGGAQPAHDAARHHHPAHRVLGQDLQEAAARPAGRRHPCRQGGRSLRAAGRVVRGRCQAGCDGEGRQAEAHPVRRPGEDEEPGGPGDRQLRQGDRGGRDLHQDQRHQV